MPDLQIRMGIKSYLRSINLHGNKLACFKELGQSECKQLLILNVSNNKLTSAQEIAKLLNLQFLNLGNNLITDGNQINELFKLQNLQELYLHGNMCKFSFGQALLAISQSRMFRVVWPHLEVLDLTRNTTQDLEEFLYLFTGMIVKPSKIRIVAVRDNLIGSHIKDEKLP